MIDERKVQRWFGENGPKKESPPGAIWLIEGGISADGRGPGYPKGYTTDRAVAEEHYRKCRLDPYSTGGVVEVWALEESDEG